MGSGREGAREGAIGSGRTAFALCNELKLGPCSSLTASQSSSLTASSEATNSALV